MGRLNTTDLVAVMQQMANEQTQDMEMHLVGRVIEYDPKSGMCRAVIDSRRAEDEDGIYGMETGWMQVGSAMVGEESGDQYHLKGGAEKDNEEGEQVQISVQHRSSGLCAVANLAYTDKHKPPGAGEDGESGDDEDDNARDDEDAKLQLRPEERIIKMPSGSLIKFYKNGDVQVIAKGIMVVNADKDIDVNVKEGNINVNIEKGNANLTLTEGDCNIEIEDGDLTANLSLGNAETNIMIGDSITYVEEGNITAIVDDGHIAMETSTGTISLTAAEQVDITAPLVNIISAIVNIGAGIFQKLCNLAFLELFNSHTHIAPNGGGTTTPPTVPAIPGIETTTDLEAS